MIQIINGEYRALIILQFVLIEIILKTKNKSSFSLNSCFKQFCIKIVNTTNIKDIECSEYKKTWRYIDCKMIGKKAPNPILFPMAPIPNISKYYIDYYYDYIHKDDKIINNNHKNKTNNHIDDVSSEQDEDEDDDQKKDPDYNEKEDRKQLQRKKINRKRTYSQFTSKKQQIDDTFDLISTSEDEQKSQKNQNRKKRRKLSDDETFEIVEIVENNNNQKKNKKKVIKKKKIDDSVCFEKVEKFCKENNNKYPTFTEIEKLCDIETKQAKELILRYFSHKKDIAEYVALESNEYQCQCTKCLQIFAGLTAVKRMEKHIKTVHNENKKQNKDKTIVETKENTKNDIRTKNFNFHDYNINRNRKKIHNNDNPRIPPPLSPFNDQD